MSEREESDAEELFRSLWLFSPLVKTRPMGRPWDNGRAKRWWAHGRHVRLKEPAPSAEVRPKWGYCSLNCILQVDFYGSKIYCILRNEQTTGTAIRVHARAAGAPREGETHTHHTAHSDSLVDSLISVMSETLLSPSFWRLGRTP